ncbi:MAG: reverse gyrase [Archaeoglobus sp.]|nr:reverse gyrase [Archaeoglobus sp.]
MKVIYSSLCPVCGGDLAYDEVEVRTCKKKNTPLCVENERCENFIRFFRKAIGEPRAIQKTWAKRILSGESFAAIAPTGIGKTSFGIAISLFLATEGRKSYIILPTTLLLEQVVSNIRKYAESLGITSSFNGQNGRIRVAYYHGRLKKEEKEGFFRSIKEADILVTTTQFLSRHFSEIKDLTFDFIFVDDVDAILKASKNVERILNLLGFRYDRYENDWKGKKVGCLMVSTATAKKGRKADLFRRLLNFDIGSSTFTVRNIEDIALKSLKGLNDLITILEKMGSGGLIFARNSEEMQRIHDFLTPRFKVGLQTDFEKFKNCELDFLVGTSHYYGSLVRGLDLPEKIRYAVFVGVPAFRIRFEDIEDPTRVSDRVIRILLLFLRDKDEVKEFLKEFLKTKGLERVVIQAEKKIDRRYAEKMMELRKFLKKVLEESDFQAADVVLRKKELIIPDVRTYIQASGRTSRLHSGGITKGVSFILEEDQQLFYAFKTRAQYFDIDISVRDINEIDFARLRREVDESREKFSKREELDLIKPALFIVESPVKARHISRFFGKPSVRVLENLIVYEVPTSEYILQITASLGHVTDLITNRGFHGVEILDSRSNSRFVPVFSSIKRCLSCGYQFTLESKKCPRCGSEDINDSRRRIDSLRKLAYEAGRVIIGTDPDSEGEKIAWDLRNLLSGCSEIKRAEFHEVTRRAVSDALSNLREIDESLVKAQIVRRVEDRWIGFVLSLKLQEVFKEKNLSAGRAQTPVLGWILERTKESKKKKIVALIEDLDLILDFGVGDELGKDFERPGKFGESEESEGSGESGESEIELEIELRDDRVVDKSPLPPYTTDTLLRDANRILKLSATQAMKIAQDLFENGLITYHRTDSTRVSDAGLRVARDYLGNDFFPREWYAEGAHECIRPTRALDRMTLQRLIYEGLIKAESLEKDHLSLYELIFRRFMASQCRNLKVRIGRYKVKYDGKVLEENRILSVEGKAYELYKSVAVRKELPLGKMVVKAKIKEIPKAPLYSEAEVIQLMKDRGIGRPSTYATIIERLFERGYVFEKNGKIRGTKRGFSVFSFLSKNYSNLVSEKRTMMLEEKMDKIAKGELDYMEALNELYEEIKSIS